MKKSIKVVSLILSLIFCLSLIFNPVSARLAKEDDGPAYLKPGYSILATATTGWFDQKHGDADDNKGGTYSSFRATYAILESDEIIGDYCIGTCINYMNIDREGQVFNLSEMKSYSKTYSFTKSVTNSLTTSLSNTVKSEVSASFKITEDIGVGGGLSNSVTASVSDTLTTSYSKSYTQTFTFSRQITTPYTSPYSSGYFGGFYVIPVHRWRVVIIALERQEYKSVKDGCNYEWQKNGSSKKITCNTDVGSTYYVPTKEYINGDEPNGEVYKFFKTYNEYHNYLINKNK